VHEVKIFLTPRGYNIFNTVTMDLEELLKKFKEGYQQMMSGTSNSGGRNQSTSQNRGGRYSN